MFELTNWIFHSKNLEVFSTSLVNQTIVFYQKVIFTTSQINYCTDSQTNMWGRAGNHCHLQHSRCDPLTFSSNYRPHLEYDSLQVQWLQASKRRQLYFNHLFQKWVSLEKEHIKIKKSHPNKDQLIKTIQWISYRNHIYLYFNTLPHYQSY